MINFHTILSITHICMTFTLYLFYSECDHPNLCRFICGTIEVPDVAIVSEYCAKGSLNDVLLNEDVPLSYAFR